MKQINDLSFTINEYNKCFPLDESIRSAVKYCIEHNILKRFLEKHASEVINMLCDDITIEEIADIRYREGIETGREEANYIIARNLLAEGSTPEFIQKITGLSIKEIEQQL